MSKNLIAWLAFLVCATIPVCLIADCANSGPVLGGCEGAPEEDSRCVGFDEAHCEADKSYESKVSYFGCGQVNGRFNCRTGVDKAECYIEYTCVYHHNAGGCAAQDPDSHTTWVKNSDACPGG